MRHRTRLARLRLLLMASDGELPPFIIHITDDDGNITETHTIFMRF